MRWGLIGASTIASQWVIGAIREQPGASVDYVVSSSRARGPAYADEHNIPSSGTSVDDCVGDPNIDAVYISTTNEKHFAQAMAAIDAGKHVLCEKPLAMSLGEAAEMVRKAQTAGVIFATNHHLRCSGSHRAIRALVEAGEIGTPLSLRIHHAVHLPESLQGWRIDNKGAGGGVVLDLVVHDADVTRFLLGEDPQTVMASATASGMGQGVEDSSMVLMQMPSGAMVMTHESFTHPFAGSGLELHGTKGSVFARDVMTQQPVGEVELVTKAGRKTVTFDATNLYVTALREFYAAVAGQGGPAADGPDGVKSLAVALAALQSAETGTRQTVDYGGF